MPILSKYPPLTSRFYCQIKYLEKSIDNFTVKDYILTKNTKYNFQIIHSNIINNFIYFDKLPNYFEQWLGGFIETKGSFNVININKNYSFTISQNKDYYLLQIIIKFYESKIKIKQISDIYEIEFNSLNDLHKIVNHCKIVLKSSKFVEIINFIKNNNKLNNIILLLNIIYY